jgi:hypothetical protein
VTPVNVTVPAGSTWAMLISTTSVAFASVHTGSGLGPAPPRCSVGPGPGTGGAWNCGGRDVKQMVRHGT